MNVPKRSLFKPIFFLSFMGFILSSTSFFLMHHHITTYTLLSNFYEGNGVCFSRVAQTFTARMLGRVKSEHLSPRFIQITGECYEDLAENFQDKLTSYPFLSEQLQDIISSIHRFHEKLGTQVLNLLGGEQGNDLDLIEGFFAKTEEVGDKVNRFIETHRIQTLDAFWFYVFFLGLGVLLMAATIIGSFAKRFSLYKFSQNIEEKASQPELSWEKIEAILRNVLSKHGYKNCPKLLNQYHLDLKKDYEKTPKQARKERQESDLQPIPLAPTLEHLCLSIRDHILQQGIQLELNIPEHLVILCEPEAALQIIYDLFISQIRTVSKEKEPRSINIQAQASGSEVILSFSHSGRAHEKSLVNKMNRKRQTKGIPSEFLVARELLREMQGKIQLVNGNGLAQVKLFFQRANKRTKGDCKETNKRFTKSILRGKKSEIF